MIKRFCHIILCLVVLGNISWAQLIIKDGENEEILSGAEIKIISLKTNRYLTLISDKKGKIEIPLDFLFPIAVEVNYLGFNKFSDTIFSRQIAELQLQKEFKYLKEAVISDPLSKKKELVNVNNLKILNAETFERMAAVTVRDVLANQLNFRINQDNATGSSQMSLQGIGGQNVKILIDGIPVIGKVFDQVDLSQLNLANIERIEIVQGPMSVSYGTNALAGTINIITKKPVGKRTEIGLNAYHESNATYNFSGNYNWSNSKWSGQFNGGRNFFGGWSATETDRTWDWNLKELYFSRLQLAYRLKSWELNFRTDLNHEKIKVRGKPDVYGEKAIDEYFFTNRLDQAFQVTGKIGKNVKSHTVVGVNLYNREREKRIKDLVHLSETPSLNVKDYDTTTFKSLLVRSTFQRSYKKSAWFSGFDVSQEWGKGERIKQGNGSMGDYALFGSFQWFPIKPLEIRSGMRIGYHTAYKNPMIPSLQLAYALPNNFNVRVSWARGFRAPTLKELYLNFVDANHQVFGNENLQAETSSNYQLGIDRKWQFKKSRTLKIEASTFYNNIDNKIDLFITSPTSGVYQNTGWFNSRGLNTSLQMASPAWKHQLGWACTGIQSANFGGKSTPVRWNYEGQYNMLYFIEKYQLSLSLFIKYNSAISRIFINAESLEKSVQKIDPYSLADFIVNKKIKNSWQLSAGVKNIFNVTNVASTLNSGAHSGNSQQAIGTGRTGFVKIAYTWKKG